MELRQLSYVEAVARYGGFTRAAERLHVAQSAVSAQIRALEAELGLELFARTTRRVALTPAGELFVARARRVLAELDGARTEINEITTVVSGRVTIGAVAGLGSFDLVDALARFRDRYPGIALRVRSGLITGLLGALDAGEVDLVVGPLYPDLPVRFEGLPLTDEQLVLALPVGHAASRVGRLTLGEVRDEAFVSLPPGSGLRWILEDAARSAGFTARVEFEAADAAGIRSLVAAGLGVGLLPRHVAEAAGGPAIMVRGLHPAPVHPPIGVMHSRDRPLPAAAQSCRHHLVEAAAHHLGLASSPTASPEAPAPEAAAPQAPAPQAPAPEAPETPEAQAAPETPASLAGPVPSSDAGSEAAPAQASADDDASRNAAESAREAVTDLAHRAAADAPRRTAAGKARPRRTTADKAGIRRTDPPTRSPRTD